MKGETRFGRLRLTVCQEGGAQPGQGHLVRARFGGLATGNGREADDVGGVDRERLCR